MGQVNIRNPFEIIYTDTNKFKIAEKIVTKEITVEKLVEVIKEVPVDRVVEKIVEVIKEIPVDKIKSFKTNKIINRSPELIIS
jgi:hypothetical protein